MQSHLPHGTSPLCFILYANKTRLSSFGTKKGYPIVACCANLPIHIRNGEGIGGGQIVGWLPIMSLYTSLLKYSLTMQKVEEDSAEAGEKGFVNHKQVVWHASFLKLLESAIRHSKTGYHH